MRLSVIVEQRFDRTPDGAVWTSGQFPRDYWNRHLTVFDDVNVVARVREIERAPFAATRADGNGVSVSDIPYYEGPGQYLRRIRAIRRAVIRAVAPEDAVLLRIGSQIASVLEPELRRRGQPFGVEVVTDPFEIFSPHAVTHPLRPWFRWSFTRAMRRQCAHAAVAAYVTEHVLQDRYPPARAAFTTHYSDGDLDPDAFVESIAPRPLRPGSIHLVSIGSLAQMYKAPDVLIKALAKSAGDGLDVRLTWVGDGKYRPGMEALAETCGVRDRVEFVGQVPAGDPVRTVIDSADIFLQVSRTEGLPRALVEAMARGAPCIGTAVGGIPELLEPNDLVAPGDVEALAAKISEMATNPERLACAGARNLQRSHDYATEPLRRRREAMMRNLRNEADRWLASSAHRSAVSSELA